MVQVNVEILNIETDQAGQMITLTVETTVGEIVEEIRFGEMVGNLRGKTNTEVRQHFKKILQDVIRQRIGMREELNTEKLWKRAQEFIGNEYVIDTEDVEEPLTIDNITRNYFMRGTDDEMKVWKLAIRSGVMEITETSVEEVLTP